MNRPKRQVSYRWQLRALMAERGMYATTELVPLLAERGIDLSVSQVHRLVTTTPERLSLPVLAALCDIFTVTPADLIVTTAADAIVRKTAAGGGRGVSAAELAALRPKPARVLPKGCPSPIRRMRPATRSAAARGAGAWCVGPTAPRLAAARTGSGS